MSKLSRFVKSTKGGVMVLMAFVLPILIILVGFILDIGRVYVVQTQLQSVLDAATLAAANTGLTINDGTNPPYAVIPTPDGPDAADAFWNNNKGIINNGNFTEVSYQKNPEGDANYSNGKIHIVATIQIPTTFSKLFNIYTFTITRDSWATVVPK